MNENKNLAIKNDYFSPVVWGQMKDMAQVFIESRALPENIKNAQQAIMIMQSGYEMGMKPLESVKSLYIVNGQINIWGSALIKRLREHGWRIEYEDVTKEPSEKIKKEMEMEGEKDTGGGVRVTVRKDKEKYTEEFYFYQARLSGWTKTNGGYLKPGWTKGANRKLKLRYAAVSMVVKTYIAEVMGSAHDIQEIAEDYPVEETPEETKIEEGTVMTGTSEQRKNSLTDFLKKDKEKNKDKGFEVNQDNVIETLEKTQKGLKEVDVTTPGEETNTPESEDKVEHNPTDPNADTQEIKDSLEQTRITNPNSLA